MTFPPDADRLLATLRDGAWLDAQVFPPLAYAVPGLIPEGSVLLVGAPKIGNSWLALSIALAAADGGKALGLDVPKRPVLYAALEDGDRRLQDRCRRLLGTDPMPPEFQYLTRVEPARIADTIAAWVQFRAEPLVILDTLGKVLPPAMQNETTYQRDYRVGSALKRIVDTSPGATLLVNHHQRKAGAEDFVDAVSGTAGLAGAADTVIVLSRDRNETSGLLKVTGRDVAEGEYAVTFKDGAVWELDGHDLATAREKAQKVRATTRATAGPATACSTSSSTPTPTPTASAAATSPRRCTWTRKRPRCTWPGPPTPAGSSGPNVASTPLLSVLPLLPPRAA
jgi:RecA-family ATPase